MRSASDADLTYVLPYKNMKGEAFEQEVKEIVLHINNHGTYHRGQLVTMLRHWGWRRSADGLYTVQEDYI
jgi:uncharacterized damage-inducible protein DinB